MIQSIKIILNKTTFTLNNDAYNKLNEYVSALKISFKTELEILFDIEARIAELLTLQLAATNNEIVEENHVNEVIKTLGSVEELTNSYKAENINSSNENNAETAYQNTTSKPKLRRNPFNQSLGGVCSGIAHYLNIDTSFVRIAFVFAFFFFGTGILAYLVLWIVIPKAIGNDADLIIQRENNNPHKLYRNNETKAIGGVCSGLALYFGIEIWVVRLVFFAGLFLYGSTFLVYIIAWIIIPKAINYLQKTNLNNNLNYVAQNDAQVNGIRNIFKFIIAAIAMVLLGIILVSFFFSAALFSSISDLNIFEYLQSTILFDEDFNLVITGLLLCFFTPVLLLFAIIAKFGFKASISFKYAGMGLVILFFTGVGLLTYSGINIFPKYINQIENSEIEFSKLSNKDSIYFIINEVKTNKHSNFYEQNGFKIELCDTGRFVPINYEISETLEDTSSLSISKYYMSPKVLSKKKDSNYIYISYSIKGDSVIFPSHYFLPKSYPFVFQRVKVKYYLKRNTAFFANKTAQQAFGFIDKKETPSKYWFNINKLDDYEKWNDKMEEKEAELERKADNL